MKPPQLEFRENDARADTIIKTIAAGPGPEFMCYSPVNGRTHVGSCWRRSMAGRTRQDSNDGASGCNGSYSKESRNRQRQYAQAKLDKTNARSRNPF
jgi:hypothetical protein